MELYWSKRGLVACLLHAPAPDSLLWENQGWQAVPGWRRLQPSALQCQFCHGRPYVHRSRPARAPAARPLTD